MTPENKLEAQKHLERLVRDPTKYSKCLKDYVTNIVTDFSVIERPALVCPICEAKIKVHYNKKQSINSNFKNHFEWHCRLNGEVKNDEVENGELVKKSKKGDQKKIQTVLIER